MIQSGGVEEQPAPKRVTRRSSKLTQLPPPSIDPKPSDTAKPPSRRTSIPKAGKVRTKAGDESVESVEEQPKEGRNQQLEDLAAVCLSELRYAATPSPTRQLPSASSEGDTVESLKPSEDATANPAADLQRQSPLEGAVTSVKVDEPPSEIGAGLSEFENSKRRLDQEATVQDNADPSSKRIKTDTTRSTTPVQAEASSKETSYVPAPPPAVTSAGLPYSYPPSAIPAYGLAAEQPTQTAPQVSGHPYIHVASPIVMNGSSAPPFGEIPTAGVPTPHPQYPPYPYNATQTFPPPQPPFAPQYQLLGYTAEGNPVLIIPQPPSQPTSLPAPGPGGYYYYAPPPLVPTYATHTTAAVNLDTRTTIDPVTGRILKKRGRKPGSKNKPKNPLSTSTPPTSAPPTTTLSTTNPSTDQSRLPLIPQPSTITTGERARTHVCPSCPLSFFRSQDLQRHKSTHLHPSERAYLCSRGCGRRFGRLDAAARHAKTSRLCSMHPEYRGLTKQRRVRKKKEEGSGMDEAEEGDGLSADVGDDGDDGASTVVGEDEDSEKVETE
ncbi:hypothetical protein HDV05_000446 [Chytridiales sp. JEL 0842]|nr:hypothetical protein HDV05_000446 [Chytridiales sp. JEL 0842]